MKLTPVLLVWCKFDASLMQTCTNENALRVKVRLVKGGKIRLLKGGKIRLLRGGKIRLLKGGKMMVNRNLHFLPLRVN